MGLLLSENRTFEKREITSNRTDCHIKESRMALIIVPKGQWTVSAGGLLLTRLNNISIV